MRGPIIVVSCIAALPVLVLIALLIGPEVDNHINVLNAINLEAAKDYRVHCQRLEDFIAKRYKIIDWRSYHPDTLYTSTVTCLAQDAQGHTLVLSWEVGRFHHLDQNEGRKLFYLTPLTDSACCLTPWLGNPGMACYNYPRTPINQATSYLWPEGERRREIMRRSWRGSDSRACGKSGNDCPQRDAALP